MRLGVPLVRTSEHLSSGESACATAVTTQAGWYAVGGGDERYRGDLVWTEETRPVPSYVGVEHRDGRFLTAV